MSYKYNRRNQPYNPGQKEPYKLSRSRIELFKQCPRCFWLDERLKIKRPSGPPFQINKAIDELLKKEFDFHRSKKSQHPIMIENKVKAVPYEHKDLNKWRENFVGVGALHEHTNLYIFGAVDDIWVNKNDELIVVDYKATAKQSEVSLDADWQISYKRQIEIYQWLLRANGFKVSNISYFVYTNARMDLDGFNNKVEFKTKLIKYVGDDSWLEQTLKDIKKCLEGDMPKVGIAIMGGECDFCAYAKKRSELTLKHLQNSKKTV
jgi:CRISPR/Cas system-associated exonuclease Cas4 (RecB family)